MASLAASFSPASRPNFDPLSLVGCRILSVQQSFLIRYLPASSNFFLHLQGLAQASHQAYPEQYSRSVFLGWWASLELYHPCPTANHFHHKEVTGTILFLFRKSWTLTVLLLEPGVPDGPGQPLLPCQRNRRVRQLYSIDTVTLQHQCVLRGGHRWVQTSDNPLWKVALTSTDHKKQRMCFNSQSGW